VGLRFVGTLNVEHQEMSDPEIGETKKQFQRLYEWAMTVATAVTRGDSRSQGCGGAAKNAVIAIFLRLSAGRTDIHLVIAACRARAAESEPREVLGDHR
jgi:hypothetical protein